MGRTHEIEGQSETTKKHKETISEKGKWQPETNEVTRSSSEMMSDMSQPEVSTESTKNIKPKNKEALGLYSASSRLKQICSSYACSMKEAELKSHETATQEQDSVKEKDDLENSFSFEYSKRLIALAKEREAEIRRSRRSESNRFSRKRKASGNRGSHGNGAVDRKRQRLSQSQPSFEETEDSSSGLEKIREFVKKQTNEWSKRDVIMKPRNSKIRTTSSKAAPPVEYEFSRRLVELSRKKSRRFQPHEHEHCCRCVQSFECFWPRSNLQTIRRQGLC